MKSDCRISVVMAVYNVRDFLAEAIQSILDQDIGRENLQLVLVDDGSPDGSGEICDEYGRHFPDCVTVIHQENGGVSRARNAGLEQARGRYVTFTDSDDKLTPDTCRLVCDFLDAHNDEIDIASIPFHFFDASTGSHILNYKFDKGTRVIDLESEWNCPQLSMSASFAKTEVVRRFGFDTRLAYAEDAKCALRIQALRNRLGVVAEARYLYRKRAAGASSALQTSYSNPKWYLPPVRHFHLALLEEFGAQGRAAPRFVQFALTYDLQWRIKQGLLPRDILSTEDCHEYRTAVAKAFSQMDDEVIVTQRHMNAQYKFHALKLKYGVLDPVGVAWAAWQREWLAKRWLSWLIPRCEFLKRTDYGWKLEGSLPLYAGVDVCNLKVVAQFGKERAVSELTPLVGGLMSLDEKISESWGFSFAIPSNRLAPHDIRLSLLVGKSSVPLKTMTFGPFFPFSKQVPRAYFYGGGLKMTVNGDRFVVSRCGFLKHLVSKMRFMYGLLRLGNPYAQKAFALHLLRDLIRPFKRSQIWVISDRTAEAGDNGETLFRHLAAHPVPRVKPVFVLSRKSPKFAELSRLGCVVDTFSAKHKLVHVLADCTISSQADAFVVNPMPKPDYYRDILWNRPFVFLQHGITKDDLSEWLNRRNKNIQGFVTTARPEWRSVIDGAYGYAERNVWLTGMPRFDLLENHADRKILIMPTWRRTLTAGFDRDSGRWRLCRDFAETDFCRFYNGIMNHPQVMKACAIHGYRMVLVLHPNLRAAIPQMQVNDFVDVIEGAADYGKLFAEASLQITDYSSTAFDFAYLRKPVVYTQFDEADFFAGGHAYVKGYFDYRLDGFGPVCTTVDETAGQIVRLINGACRLSDEYRKRIDSFFAFSDRENCIRVVDKLKQLMGR